MMTYPIALFIIALCGGAPAQDVVPSCEGLAESIRALSFSCPAPLAHGAAECASARLFYAKRADAPAWVDCRGFKASGHRLTEELFAQAARDGLRTSDYVDDAWRATPWSMEAAAEIDLALTRALLRYTGDFRLGRVDPITFRAVIHQGDRSLLDAVERIAEGTEDTIEVLRSIAPDSAGFDALWSELRRGTASSSVAARLALNLERWKGLVSSPSPRRVVVNVPAYTGGLLRDEQRTMTMRVIVGRTDRPTPLFRARLARVVLNPMWSVPRKIALLDILPMVKKDPTYLKTHHFRVFARNGNEELDAQAIDWAQLDGFPYRFGQDAGPWSALGRVKIEAPNPHAVLLHGTSNPELFARERRTLSSGCIRLEHPESLAFELLRDQGWSRDDFDRVLDSGTTTVITLEAPTDLETLELMPN